MKRPDAAGQGREGDARLTRAVRITLVAVLVYAVQSRLVDPARVAADPDLHPMPWAILALLVPVALGVWTFELATRERPAARTDALWGVLTASLAYVATLLLRR